MSYAEGTKVAVSKTIAEIEDLVRKSGGERFYRGEHEGKMVLGWWQKERMIMFGVELKPLSEFAKKPGSWRTLPVSEQEKRRDQAMREKWRAMLLVIKAKYASVEAKIETFEESFLGQLVVPDPETGRHSPYARIAIKAIADVYTGGNMKALGSGS